jgi:hypothetical protein
MKYQTTKQSPFNVPDTVGILVNVENENMKSHVSMLTFPTIMLGYFLLWSKMVELYLVHFPRYEVTAA